MVGFDQNKRHRAQLEVVLSYAQLTDLPESTKDQLAAVRKDKPIIVALYYGGTLGMIQDDRGRLIPSDDAERLLQPLKIKGIDKKVQVVWMPVYERAIDSTNGRWVHWASIGNAIRLLYDLVDGFIVCGGTDTMAHLMAALNFMFPNIGKPIIGAGAQLPMVELGDDATSNIYFSISCAASDLSGAHLAFGDELMHGLFVHKVQDRRFHAFSCPDQHRIGHFDGSVHLYHQAPRRNPLVIGERLQFRPHFQEGIKVVRISPATPSESILYDADDPTCSALLLITFGAGNTRDEGIVDGEMTHVECLRQLYDRKYPVVLGSPMMDGEVNSPYKAGMLSVSTEEGGGGAISAGNTTGPALEVKCMVALAGAWDEASGKLDFDKFRELMTENMIGELSTR
ncbi:MAG: asparaginase domain-containing protein [Patescibacteria group bacterium]